VRSDEKLGPRRKPKLWSGDAPAVWSTPGDPMRDPDRASGSVSFSGLERNKLFLNLAGEGFEDVSSLSGADSIADSRGVALFDYDRDGWQDLVLINTNKPLLQLYRNRMGEHGARGRVIALRLVGGNADAKPSSEFSNRDGIGALITAEAGDLTLTRERRLGEGFAVQNSGTLLLGIGEHEAVDRLRVRWPSGRVEEVSDVAAGTLVTLYEDSSRAPANVAVVRTPYHADTDVAGRRGVERALPELLAFAEAGGGPALSLFITTATWCEACKASLPQVSALRASFPGEELALLGVPIDPDDNEEKLRSYVSEWQPAYRLLIDASTGATEQIQALILHEFGDEILPAAIATDRAGQIIAMWDEVPTLSELRRVSAGLAAGASASDRALHGAR
jgi:peroxiredoxin